MQVWPVVEANEGVPSGDRKGSFESKIGKMPESRKKGKAVWIRVDHVQTTVRLSERLNDNR